MVRDVSSSAHLGGWLAAEELPFLGCATEEKAFSRGVKVEWSIAEQVSRVPQCRASVLRSFVDFRELLPELGHALQQAATPEFRLRVPCHERQLPNGQSLLATLQKLASLEASYFTC